ncbi:MAG: hypothetical protein HYR84_06995 [Planctomycetes bacterium]|nr:hypothetical protein [Planctomycetota bacterium]
MTANQELLLNLVRDRYRDPPEFLAISGITTQSEIASDLGFGNEFGLASARLAGKIGAADRPTVTLTPLQNEQFTKRFLAPISLETIYLFTRNGRRVERAFPLIMQNINGVKNRQDFPSEFEAFSRMTKSLAELARQRLVEIAYDEKIEEVAPAIELNRIEGKDLVTAADKDLVFRLSAGLKSATLTKKKRELVLRVAPEALDRPDWQAIVTLLHLKKGQRMYRLKPAIEGQLKPVPAQEGREEILISTRSVEEIFDFLSYDIDVPKQHVERGIAPSDAEATGASLGLLRIRTAKARPHHAAVAVPYRGHWFFIDDCDGEAKATFEFLLELYHLEIRGGGAASLPVLTLSVGR